MKFGTEMSNVTVIVSEVKVKVQGQKRHTENIPLALARL